MLSKKGINLAADERRVTLIFIDLIREIQRKSAAQFIILRQPGLELSIHDQRIGQTVSDMLKGFGAIWDFNCFRDKIYRQILSE